MVVMLNDDNGQRSCSFVDSSIQCFSEVLHKLVVKSGWAGESCGYPTRMADQLVRRVSTLVICCQAVPKMCQQSKWQAQGYVCNEPPMAMCPPPTR